MADHRYDLSAETQAQMLRKLLLYWDGQWFLKTVEAYGLDSAIALNARVRRSFGRIEMRTLLKAVGKPQAEDLPDALRLLATYADVFMGAALRAEFVTLDDDHAEVRIRRCAAYEGARRANLPRQDQACVACEGLWPAWLETLLPDTPLRVEAVARMGLGDQVCLFRITKL